MQMQNIHKVVVNFTSRWIEAINSFSLSPREMCAVPLAFRVGSSREGKGKLFKIRKSASSHLKNGFNCLFWVVI